MVGAGVVDRYRAGGPPTGARRGRGVAVGLLVDHQPQGDGEPEMATEGGLDLEADVLAVGPVRLVGEGEDGGTPIHGHEATHAEPGPAPAARA